MKTLTLHAHNSGPNPYKVALVLENLKIPYELKLWDFGDGENGVKGPNYLKINENGRVPALEDPNSSVVAWESTACVNHLLRTYDTSYTLHPDPSKASPQDLVDYDKWTSFLTTTLGPMMGQLNWYTHYNPTPNEDARARYEAQAHRCFEVLEGQLGKSGGKSVLPGGFSAVDCHFYPWVDEYKYGKLDIGKYEKVKGYLKAVWERAEVQKIYEEIPKAEKAIKG
ncbi:MAG: hypothetical protein LQ346_003089 [Caloplaca aetnensis]|nr:MAG: hypothetical protein LQ346_003089 [Caloplaca aetnensis]